MRYIGGMEHCGTLWSRSDPCVPDSLLALWRPEATRTITIAGRGMERQSFSANPPDKTMCTTFWGSLRQLNGPQAFSGHSKEK